MNKQIIRIILGLGWVASQGLQAQDAARIDDYIHRLQYDPKALLAIKAPGSTTVVPRVEGRTSITICSGIPRTLDGELNQVDILSPTATNIFPGALIRANMNLADGRPEVSGLPRAPVKVWVNLPNLLEKGQTLVSDPTQSAIQKAIGTFEAAWFGDATNVQPAQQTYQVKKAYSANQISLALGFNAKWGLENSTQVDASASNKGSKSTVIALFKQKYYTAAIDVPPSPASFLARTVTLAQVQQAFNAGNPPAYVKSVDYGRMILVRMDSNSNESEADLSGAMTLVTSGATVEASMEAKYKKIINNSTLTVVTLGGNASAATQVMQGGEESLKALPKLIKSGATFNRGNPGYPIAYNVCYLKDNSQAVYGFTTNYVESNCVEYPNGYIEVKNGAAFAARWHISWFAKDASGRKKAFKLETGSSAPGFQRKFQVPGDAENVWLVGEYAAFAGVWRTFMDLTLDGPNNKTYTAKGTTFTAGYSVSGP